MLHSHEQEHAAATPDTMDGAQNLVLREKSWTEHTLHLCEVQEQTMTNFIME